MVLGYGVRSTCTIGKNLLGLLLLLAATNLFSSHVFGANVYFVPGDSFFHFHATQEIALAPESTKLSLSYSPPEHPGGGDFDGYIGFASMEISGKTEGFRRGLRVAYQEYRKDAFKVVTVVEGEGVSRKERENNPLHAFVYNADFDLPKCDIGLKYNEGWYLLGGKDDDGLPKIDRLSNRRYVSFLTGEKAAITDWRMSTRFSPLGVDVPKEVHWQESGEKLDKPVLTIAAEKVQIVVVPFGTLNSQFSAPEEFYLMRIYGSGRVEKYTYVDDEVTWTDVEK